MFWSSAAAVPCAFISRMSTPDWRSCRRLLKGRLVSCFLLGVKDMQIGVIGLGRMGGNICRRLMQAGHGCVVFDVNAKSRDELANEGATASPSLEAVAKALAEKPRVVWVMLPAGKITDETVDTLGGLLAKGDIIIDGGNSFYKDVIRRAKKP